MTFVESAIISAQKTTLDNAEVQRSSVESQLRNALYHHEVEEAHRQRIERLIRSIEAAEGVTSVRKVALMLDLVVPTLENLS